MRYSVIIPSYKSSETIERVVDMTREEMVRLGKEEVEFVLVNDCSPDDTFGTIRRLCGKDHRKIKRDGQKTCRCKGDWTCKKFRTAQCADGGSAPYRGGCDHRYG